jgi:glycerol-3-phosphate acyltransferase PlsY
MSHQASAEPTSRSATKARRRRPPSSRRARPVDLATGLALGYVAGSVSFSSLIGRWRAPGVDFSEAEVYVEQTGRSITLGGTTPTSVGAHLGGQWAGLAIALEAAKAAVPTWAARRLSSGTGVGEAVAAGAVLGHAYPLWQLGRRGGYGASPIIGGMLVLDPLGLLATNAALMAVIGITGERRLVLAWPLSLSVWAAARRRPELLWYTAAVNAILWSRLVPELRSTMSGLLSEN